MHFFLWYYTTGLLGIFRIALNAMRYAVHRFNILELLATLISPWKRDVSHQTWSGFRPILFLNALANNFLARFMGMIVRSVMIVIGLTVALATAVGAVSLALFASLAPLFLLGGAWVIGMQFGPLMGGGVFGLALVVVIVGLFGWRDHVRRHTDYSQMPEKAPWRDRVVMRLGLSPKAFDVELFRSAEKRAEFLLNQKIEPTLFDAAWEVERKHYEELQTEKRFWDWDHLKRAPRLGKYWKYAYTPKLDHYCTDLSEHDFSQYRKHQTIGREPLLEMLALTLSRPNDNSVLLVGNPGIGKRSIVHMFARRIRENYYTDRAVGDARIVFFDLGQVISDGRTQGIDPKSLLRDILNQAVYAGNVVLVIENIELYLDPESDLAVGEVLHEYLPFPTCRIIGLMTGEAYHTIGQHQIPALKYFEAIQVTEPNEADTIAILLDTFRTLESKRPVFTLQGLQSIYTSAERYNWELPFPERAIDLANEVLIYWDKQPDLPFITKGVVEDFLEAKSGIPMGEASSEEREKLLNLEALLHARVIGQDEAIKQIAEAFRKVRSGLGNDKKPIGSFLFLGPTGVGKTETAKALAAVYFGDEERMVRLDMSEFQTPQSIAELIGDASLNVEGRMTTLVREHPYSILLLDELEKAYPRALDLFLQILDEGFVTDGFGHRVNFRNTIVIATSNAGASFIHEATSSGRAIADIEDELIDHIIAEGLFRPEFLNRFDGVILFQSLTTTEMESVTQLKLEAFAQKLYQEKKIKMTFTPEAVRAIIERGYKPEFGARSINRYIADVVEDATVKRLLRGDITDGATVVFTEADITE